MRHHLIQQLLIKVAHHAVAGYADHSPTETFTPLLALCMQRLGGVTLLSRTVIRSRQRKMVKASEWESKYDWVINAQSLHQTRLSHRQAVDQSRI